MDCGCCLSKQISIIKLSMGPRPTQWYLLPSLRRYKNLPTTCVKQKEPRNTGLTNHGVLIGHHIKLAEIQVLLPSLFIQHSSS